MKLNNFLNTLWTAHLKTPEERRSFEQSIINNRDLPTIKRLRDIVKEKLRDLDARERSTDQYNTNSWAFHQAHTNGMRQAYKLIDDLLSLNNSNTKD